jgi:hypothetical protein
MNLARILKKQIHVARHYRMTARTIRNWINDGMPVREDGFFDLAEIDEWRRQKQGIVAPPGPGEPEPQPETRGKDFYMAEDKRWQAANRELEYRKRKGEREMSEAVRRATRALLAGYARPLPAEIIQAEEETV